MTKSNARQYSIEHADDYLAFLNRHIDGLDDSHSKCKEVRGRNAVKYLVILKRLSGHGHVTVFKVVGDVIRVLRVFHTAQDWQNQLKTESE